MKSHHSFFLQPSHLIIISLFHGSIFSQRVERFKFLNNELPMFNHSIDFNWIFFAAVPKKNIMTFLTKFFSSTRIFTTQVLQLMIKQKQIIHSWNWCETHLTGTWNTKYLPFYTVGPLAFFDLTFFCFFHKENLKLTVKNRLYSLSPI